MKFSQHRGYTSIWSYKIFNKSEIYIKCLKNLKIFEQKKETIWKCQKNLKIWKISNILKTKYQTISKSKILFFFQNRKSGIFPSSRNIFVVKILRRNYFGHSSYPINTFIILLPPPTIHTQCPSIIFPNFWFPIFIFW